jgi:hypothetical protein
LELSETGVSNGPHIQFEEILTTMKYTIWLQWHGRSAQTCAIVASGPLCERISWTMDGTPQHRILGESVQTKVELEARDDDRAWFLLNEWLKANRPSEKRTIQGRSYLRACRPSLRAKKA